MGSEPDRTDTVDPVDAFDQMPAATWLGRVNAELASDDAMIFS